MTDKPTPTDWPAANAAWQAALHPARPTADELHQYAVAWGVTGVADLTNWRLWEKRYNEALQVIYAMAIERDEMQEALTLTDAEHAQVERARVAMMRDGRINAVFADDLLEIIARLTSPGPHARGVQVQPGEVNGSDPTGPDGDA